MSRQLKSIAVIMCLLSYAAASTGSIGTVITRGDTRVDNYAVRGNATLFDGSVVETAQSSADLRLAPGIEIKIGADSRSTLYRDHIVLQRGTTEVSAAPSFRVEANGLLVAANQPNSRAVVSIQPKNTVEVNALSGAFGVTTGQGVLVAVVHPGHAIAFTTPLAEGAGSSEATEFSAIGLVEYQNGHYYLATDTNVSFEIDCKDMKKFVGAKVALSGKLTGKSTVCAAGVWTGEQAIVSGGHPRSPGMGTGRSLILLGATAAVASGVTYAIVSTRPQPQPASR